MSSKYARERQRARGGSGSAPQYGWEGKFLEYYIFVIVLVKNTPKLVGKGNLLKLSKVHTTGEMRKNIVRICNKNKTE